MSLKLVQTLKQFHHDGTRWCFVLPRTPKRKGQCKVIFCRRPARVDVRYKRGKLRTDYHRICNTCRCRLNRANHPEQDILCQIRNRARERGQVFALTLADLKAVPRFAEYVQRRGRGIEDLHLDRIKVERGYVPGNLQVIPCGDNLRKQREVDYAYAEGPF